MLRNLVHVFGLDPGPIRFNRSFAIACGGSRVMLHVFSVQLGPISEPIVVKKSLLASESSGFWIRL